MAYQMFLGGNKYFKDIADIDSKSTEVDSHQFDKMIVKYRPEIVALGKTVTADEVRTADKQITIDEMKRIIDEKDDQREILDMRNDYERQLGHFK